MQSRNQTVRIYPTRKQEAILCDWLEMHRLLYNHCLAERRDAWKDERRSISYNRQQNDLPAMKRAKPWYAALGSHALQETVRRVDRAFQGFFRRVRSGDVPGYPRFKQYGRFDSFTYPCVAGWKLVSLSGGKGRLKISNLGHLKVRGKCRVDLAGLDRDRMVRLTVARKNGKWYAAIGYKVPMETLRRKRTGNGVAGLDAGLSTLATLSDGTSVKRVRHLDQDLAAIKRLQKDVSRKKRGSNNRGKAVAKLAAVHERVANRRRDHLHKQAGRLARDYRFLAVEDLSVKPMMKRDGRRKAGLNRSLGDTSLSEFLKLLAYKAEEAGCEFVQVDPKNTTQDCCRCGFRVRKRLWDREHRCPLCGLETDRDMNASINILLRGLALTGRESPEVWTDSQTWPGRPSGPVEARNPLHAFLHGGG